jgi:iron only hydrogenase large subunit-like protein
MNWWTCLSVSVCTFVPCRDVDYVLTTRELGRLFRYNRVDMASLKSEHYDSPMGTGSGRWRRAAGGA